MEETIKDILVKEVNKDSNIKKYMMELESLFSPQPLKRLDEMLTLFIKCQTWRVKFRKNYWFNMQYSATDNIFLSFNYLNLFGTKISLEDIPENTIEKINTFVDNKFFLENVDIFLRDCPEFSVDAICTLEFLKSKPECIQKLLSNMTEKNKNKLMYKFYKLINTPDSKKWVKYYEVFEGIDSFDFKYLLYYALGTKDFSYKITFDNKLYIYNKYTPICPKLLLTKFLN